MKLSQRTATSTHRVLVYGPPKVGKTELCGKLAEHFNLLYFNIENGVETLVKLPPAWQDRVEVIDIPDTRTNPIGIETMLKVIAGNRVEICEQHGKVKCPLCVANKKPQVTVELNTLPADTIVVVDSLTQLSNSAMNFITLKCDDMYKPEWSDYRSQGQLLDKFLSAIQWAKYNVVCITHETETEMEDGKKKIVPVAGTREFSRNTAKYFDDVVYCEVKNKKHLAASSTGYSNTILTGSRKGVILESSDQPSLLDIFLNKTIEVKSPDSKAKEILTGLKKG